MAAKAKKEEKNLPFKVEFKEFSMEGKTFSYAGRIYPGKDGTGKVVKKYLVNLTLNGVITLKGLYLVETEDKYFLTFPQYKSKDEYKSYVFVDRDFADGELDQLVDIIASKAYT